MAFNPVLNNFENDWYPKKMTPIQQKEFEKITRTEEENKSDVKKSDLKKKSDPKNDELLHSKRKEYIYSITSQATYELTSNHQKGSFCCLLRNNTNKKYYVLTAYHCLDTNAIEINHKALLINNTETINLVIDTESVNKNTALSTNNLDASIIKVETKNIEQSIFYEKLISPQTPCECKNKGNGSFVAYNQVCEKIKSEEPKKWRFEEIQGKLDGSSGGLLMNISEQFIGVYDGGTNAIDYSAFCEIKKILGESYNIV